MSKPTNKIQNTEAKKNGNKASRIRSRIKNGKKVGPQTLAWLAEWDGRKGPKKAVKASGDVVPPPEPKKSTDAPTRPDKPEKTPPPPGKEKSKAAPPQAPKPPPPPLPKDAPKMGGGDWQKRYSGGESREEQCVMVAALWMKGLVRMNADIVELGGTPIVSTGLMTEFMLPAMVLTVDKFAPADLDVDPTIISALGTSMVTAQRLYVGRTQAAKDKKAEKETDAAMRMVAPPPKPSEPKPKPKPIIEVTDAVETKVDRKAPLGNIKEDHNFKEGDYA